VLAFALALSVVGLAIGPVLGRWAHGRGRALAALDAATLALVPGVILLRLLPHLIEDAGVSALIGFALGYVVLQLAEATSHRRATTIGLAVVLPALAIHAFFDGATLAVALSNDVLGSGGAMLATALLVHRIPEGLFLASAMSAAGARGVRWGIVAISIATIIGALAGRELLHHDSGDALHVAVAVGLGVMLRLVMHRHDVDAAPDRTAQRIAGITFVGCLAVVVLVPNPTMLWEPAQAHELSIGDALVPLFLETSLIVLGLLAFTELCARVLRITGDPADTWVSTSVLGAWVLGPCLAIIGALAGVLGPLSRWFDRRSSRDAPWWHALVLPARHVLPLYCVGVVLAVVAESALPVGSFDGLDLLVIPAAAVIGAMVALGAGAPLIAAILVHKGAPMSAVVAFLVATAIRDAASRYRRGRIAAIVISIVVGLVLAPLVESCPMPSLHDVGRHAHSVVEWTAAAILGAWIVVDLARFGPRSWIRRPTDNVTHRPT